ncbi:DUF3237 domain-containing protein [Novosphingobium sp.]|uniref:DUF3237 domain-containing protein n=1 Tax=Novosphingobium sp. TaxID=1874826 RepID=UPI0026292133|nr:DUF3237 domain-containing protein [Novosphingobium sp.]
MIRTLTPVVATVLAFGPVTASAADPAPPALRFVFEERVDLETPEPAGEGPRGAGNRIGLLGGTVKGPRLNGTILPGGADWQLIRKDGCAEIVADYFIRADDKSLIHIRNVGLACPPGQAREAYARANPVFTAPVGPHDWLNKSVFTSTIEPVRDANGTLKQVVLRFYEVL